MAGHQAGVEAVRRTIQTAAECEISMMTLYAFSSDNWKRPATEVNSLMNLFRHNLLKAARDCVQKGIRLSVIGRRDRINRALRVSIEASEALTLRGTRMHVCVAIDYSAREAITSQLQKSSLHRTNLKGENNLSGQSEILPDVDLLIRTSGEQRLSDFLLWECAYAELYFTQTLWPDFGRNELLDAIQTFHTRDRRFGSVRAA